MIGARGPLRVVCVCVCVCVFASCHSKTWSRKQQQKRQIGKWHCVGCSTVAQFANTCSPTPPPPKAHLCSQVHCTPQTQSSTGKCCVHNLLCIRGAVCAAYSTHTLNLSCSALLIHPIPLSTHALPLELGSKILRVMAVGVAHTLCYTLLTDYYLAYQQQLCSKLPPTLTVHQYISPFTIVHQPSHRCWFFYRRAPGVLGVTG